MSEYQYYEFRAIDRPLSKDEMGKLRACSSRATITSTSFVNEYNYGDLKADPEKWMAKYFDAYLYLANWGTRILEFRLPVNQLDPKVAKEYLVSDSASVRLFKDKIIVSFTCDETRDEDWMEAEGELSSMISIREDIARGDRRSLYLGWLLCAQNCDLDDEEIEPPVPPGLGKLSTSLKSLVDFLDIDNDLVKVAAQKSPVQNEPTLDRNDIQAWIANVPVHEKNELLTGYLLDSDIADLKALRMKFLKESSGGENSLALPRRTVGELLRAAEQMEKQRTRATAARDAKKEALRIKEEAIARVNHLDKLVGNESQAWARVENLISSKVPKNYDEAVRILVDLRDLDQREMRGEFSTAVETLRRTHERKQTFLDRLVKAGL
jgi:hypothetical protein